MRKLLRPAAVVAAAALAVTTLAAPAQAAPADRAGTWLGKQLTDGVVHNDQFDFDDLGLTADVALGLDAIGGHRRKVRRISTAVAEQVDAYTAPAEGEVYAGPVAKAAVLALVAGRDPRSFGGVDLVARLEDRTADSGRIADESQHGDFANTIGQAFAARALTQVGSNEAAAARGFLLQQQCSEGYFRIAFSDKAAEDQSCDAAGGAPNVDVTALAVIALEALPTKGRKVRRSVNEAAAWLKSVQKKNGSFEPGDSAEEGRNANSTGLAAWALGETGRCAVAAKAATWVKGLQVRGKLAGTPFAGDKGAIAYDKAAYAAAESAGITDATRDQWRRTTAQATPGLSYVAGC